MEKRTFSWRFVREGGTAGNDVGDVFFLNGTILLMMLPSVLLKTIHVNNV
jgi:hypothetical protein